jgi:hypothetical protein
VPLYSRQQRVEKRSSKGRHHPSNRHHVSIHSVLFDLELFIQEFDSSHSSSVTLQNTRRLTTRNSRILGLWSKG